MASEITYKELTIENKMKVALIEKIVNMKIVQIFDGIHGNIVYLNGNDLRGARIDKEDMKDLLELGVRWVEGNSDKHQLSVGF